MSLTHIIISGDAPRRLLLSPDTTVQEVGDTHKRQAHYVHGGAGVFAQLLERRDPRGPIRIHAPDFKTDEPASIRSVVELAWHKGPDGKDVGLRQKSTQTIDVDPHWLAPEATVLKALRKAEGANGEAKANWMWLLQDADSGSSFTTGDSKVAIDLIRQVKPQYTVYHMSKPLCQGELWERLRERKKDKTSHSEQENMSQLVVIVHADDLRAEGVELSYGLSWERTCEDFVHHLGSVGKLNTLYNCAHLLVLFGCDGVVYHRGTDATPKPLLIFDPHCVEGSFAREHLGSVPGTAEAFVAGFATGLASSLGGTDFENGVESGIECGLLAAQRLSIHGLQLEQGKAAYPTSDIMQGLDERTESSRFLRAYIPSDKIVRDDNANWSLIDDLVGDPVEVGRRIVRDGVQAAAGSIPTSHIGHLYAFDRQEIESFQMLFNFVCEYLAAPQTRPLNIALCGPPSSGKAFAAFQVVKAAVRASGERKDRELRFNLAQWTNADDLRDALHSARDCTLQGQVPLVYFSGFDSPFADTPLGWLQHLLQPMGTGRFLDHHGVSRPVGPAVFLFGTTVFESTEALRRRVTFCPCPKRDAACQLQGSRLQDFLNSLHGCVDIRGSNHFSSGDGIDQLYPVRRAVVLRALLEQREKALTSGSGRLSIDEGVLNCLLLTPQYQQGIRSLRTILSMSRLNGCRQFEWAALPPSSQLELHVDYNVFVSYRLGLPFTADKRESLAEQLHEIYTGHMAKIAENKQQSEKQEPDKKETGKEPRWKDLGQELKESSRAHADSIPQKLHLLSCFSPPDSDDEKYAHLNKIDEFTDEQVELLAKEEHNRWNAERMRKNWRLSTERSVENHVSPYLVPWADLDEAAREIDRVMVRSYPKLVKVYKMGQWR